MTTLSEFNLGDNTRFQSGGFLTSLKLTKQEISKRQKRVISILEKHSGVQIIETDNGPGADLSKSGNHHIPRIIRLLEESTILQDAIYYLSVNTIAGWNSISDVTQTITLLKMEMMTNQSKKVDIYNFVDINIGEIVSDLKSDIVRGVFQPTDDEMEEIEGLESARKNFLDFFNNPGGAMMIG